MTKSNTYRLLDTGIPMYFCSSSGGMSIPPVLEPALTTIAIEAPTQMPPKSAHISRSSHNTKSPTISCIAARKTGYTKVLTSVVAAKVLPRQTSPSRNIAMLNTAVNTGMDRPVRCLAMMLSIA